MHPTYERGGRRFKALSALAALILMAACGPKAESATPTMSVQAIYTSAYETMMAQQATQLALTPPTSTPLPPTETATPLPPAPLPTFAFSSPTASTGGSAGACDSSAFVSDVTIPDNTTIDAGKAFTKTWQLLNNGTCTWSTSYSLVFSGGDQMGGSNTAIKVAVAAGSTANISVNLTAPTSNGTYKGTWRMQNASGQQFGDLPYVLIKVGNGAAATSSGSACATTCTVTGTLASGDTDHLKINFSGSTTTPDVTYTTNGFSFKVSNGWSGTITPVKGIWVFSPASVTITSISKNQNITFTLSQPPPTATATKKP